MILKKPYAFLIKHFRLLNLILFGCILYLFVSMNDLYNFFSTLHRTATYTYVGTDVYKNGSIYLFVLVGLVVSGIIFWLFKVKKKPSTLYLLIMIYLILYSVDTWYLYIQLDVLKIKVIDVDTLLLYRDVSFLGLAPAYVLLFLTFIRGIGFNVKKFNFNKDISDLEITDIDSSEVEVLVGRNNYRYARTFRRAIREFKYYILENKYVITFVAIIVVAAFSVVGFLYYHKYEKRLDESEASNVDGITYTVKSSYITSFDDKGLLIRKDYKYVVVNMSLFNSNYDSRYVDFSKVFLSNGDLKYYPSLTKNSRFYDLGIPYSKNELIPSSTEISRLFIFEIPSSVKTTNFTFNVQYELENTLTDIVAHYRKFSVKARDIDQNKKVIDVQVGEDINPNILDINPVEFKINQFSIQDTYNNKYVVCTTVDNCKVMSSVIKTNDTSLYTMLVIDYEGTMYEDSNITNKYNTFNKFLSNNASITYKKNGEYLTIPLEMTTDDEINGKVFLKVDRKIISSPEITFNLNFRNLKYEIILKK